MENVAITGLGVISSIGLNVRDFNANLLAGKVTAGPVASRDDHENIWMSLIDGFDASAWMEERVVRNSTAFSQYAVAAAAQGRQGCGHRRI